ncbi:MAG: Gfo/Idh/MocA family oxidoreductase [Thermodesulfobacteriota bacterium]
MAVGKKKVSVAIVGLGRVGSMFLTKLAEREGDGVSIVAAAEKDAKSAGVGVAKSKGIKVFSDTKDVVSMGEDVDIIFDLTGNPEARKNLRGELARSGNQHTVIAPEVVAFLLWDIMGGKEDFPGDHKKTGY